MNSPTAFQIKAGQLEALLGVGFKVLQLNPKKKKLICFHPLCSLTDIYRPLGSFLWISFLPAVSNGGESY